MKRTIITLAFSTVLAISGLAQQPPAQSTPSAAAKSLPTPEQIVDKYVQALGGKDNLMKVSSRYMKGAFEIPAMGISAPMESYAKAPNKNMVTIDIPGFGKAQQGYNGTVAWSQDPNTGLRELSGVELAATKRDAEFYQPIKMKELYPKMAVKGLEKVGESEAYAVVMTPAEGAPETWYFDKQNGLLIRQDKEMESPQGKISYEVYLDDYRDVEGSKMPFTVRQNSSAMNVVIKINEVKNNIPIEDTKFNKPPAQ